ncbi:MAG: DUF4422 domain-containing protein [Oscillospiraceae bacterium]|nr:DUF4422 domain-containing protein [Oscillospiraceae bacterium]
MDIKIIVATHKPYRMPQDKIYMPLQAGRAICSAEIDGVAGDNTGDNISEKNKNYCELTCLYWAWKNLDADYVGLCHYRRHFAMRRGGDKWANIADSNFLENKLLAYDAVLPKKRNYFIETTYQQYVHAHNKQDLDKTEEILSEVYPQYMPAYKRVMDDTKGHRFNMMIMKKDIFDSYCEWLFDILFRLEEKLDISGYSDYDKRVFGFVSERLLDVWLETAESQMKIKYTELSVVNMEKQNWLKKGTNFLKRKFIGKQ